MLTHGNEDPIDVVTPGWHLYFDFIAFLVDFLFDFGFEFIGIAECIFLAFFEEESLDISFLMNDVCNLS